MNMNVHIFNKAIFGLKDCYKMGFILYYKDKTFRVHRKDGKLRFYKNGNRNPFIVTDVEKGIKILNHLVPLLERSTFISREKDFDWRINKCFKISLKVK